MTSPFQIQGGINHTEIYIKEFSGDGDTDATVVLDLPPGFYYLGIALTCASIAGGSGTVALSMFTDQAQTTLLSANLALIAQAAGKLAALVTTGSIGYVASAIDQPSSATAEFNHVLAIPFGVKVIISHGTITSGTYSGAVFAQKVG